MESDPSRELSLRQNDAAVQAERASGRESERNGIELNVMKKKTANKRFFC